MIVGNKNATDRVPSAIDGEDLTTELGKNRYAKLTKMEAVMEQTIMEYSNIDIVLGQTAEWSHMVNTCITHQHDYKHDLVHRLTW